MPAIKLKILKGTRYGRLTVIKEGERHISPSGKKRRTVLCVCDCGTERMVQLKNLLSGDSTSCGCYQLEVCTKHGKLKTREYKVWSQMKDRCFNSKNKKFSFYGGRGITVCDEWIDFKNFFKDMGESNGLSLDRIDNNKGYSKENCRWTTKKEQARNMRTNVIYDGEYETDADARLGGASGLISRRISRGWTIEKAFTTPAGKYVYNK